MFSVVLANKHELDIMRSICRHFGAIEVSVSRTYFGYILFEYKTDLDTSMTMALALENSITMSEKCSGKEENYV